MTQPPKSALIENTRLAVGDKIRVPFYYGHEDYIVEEFRQCLGIFKSDAHREAGHFTPLCDLWGRGPDSEEKYICNYGEYWTNEVPIWMNLPRDDE